MTQSSEEKIPLPELDMVSLKGAPATLLDTVAAWFELNCIKKWMGNFQFDEFVKQLGIYTGEPDRTLLRHRFGTYGWVAHNQMKIPVGFIGGDEAITHGGRTYMCDGEFNKSAADTPRAFSFFYALPPEHRGQGYGTAMVYAMLKQHALAHVEKFSCGIDPENGDSLKLIRSIPEFTPENDDTGSSKMLDLSTSDR